MVPKRKYLLRNSNAKRKKFDEQLIVLSPCTEVTNSESETETTTSDSDDTYEASESELEPILQEPDPANHDVKPDTSENQREIGDDVTKPLVTSSDNEIYCRKLTNAMRNKSEDWFFNFSATENECALRMLNKEHIEVTATKRHDHFYLEIEVDGDKISPYNPFWLKQFVCVTETGLYELLKYLNNWNQCPKINREKCLIICEKPAVFCAICREGENYKCIVSYDVKLQCMTSHDEA